MSKEAGFSILSNVLAVWEMQKPIRKTIEALFLRITAIQAMLLGVISGAFVPVTVCIPFLFAIYTGLAEIILPGVTGFPLEGFFIAIGENVRVVLKIVGKIVLFMGLTSALAGAIEITIRRLVFTKEANNLVLWLYKTSTISISYIFLLTVGTVWKYRQEVYGLLGLSFIGIMAGFTLGYVYRSVLLLNLDNLLKLMHKLALNRS
jgi:hypothetical protein